jgi:hypothetical protein
MKISPNPFNYQTELLFVTNTTNHVRISIVNVMGNEIKTIYQGEVKSNIEYLFNFDAGNLPGGMYIYKVQTDNDIYTEKMLIVK